MGELEVESEDWIMAFSVCEVPGHYVQRSLLGRAGLHSSMFPR